MKSSTKAIVLAFALASVVAVAIAHRRTPSEKPSTGAPPTAQSMHTAATAPEDRSPPAIPMPTASATEVLRRGLADESAHVRIAAVEAAASTTSIEALGVLEDFDLKRDPEVAPTVIHKMVLLGASADDRTRDRAARTLASWLRSETKREGVDAIGNVSNLVEALGNVGGPDAVSALTSALDSKSLPLHVETLATQKLGELADGKARGSVERFAARVAALPVADGLDEELRVEAIDAARTTLARL